jgi:lipopolysaccharide transport system permease protein
MHLVKNVMLPIELIPVRTVLVGMASQFVSMAIVLVMIVLSGHGSWHFALLPVVVLLQVASLAGATWILSSLTVALPDITYIVNLVVFLLMWLSPIGFTPEMVPAEFRWILWLNPVTYMIVGYRGAMLDAPILVRPFIVYAAGSLLVFGVGAAFFRTFKSVLVDYE